MGIVTEIAAFGIQSGIEPIVGDAHMKTADGVGEGEVELLCVGRLQSHTAPCRQTQSLVSYTKSRLQGNITQIQTTPDILIHYIGSYRCLYLFFFLSDGGGSTRKYCHSHHKKSFYLFHF